ncbi:heavy metal translocating P-type ATPase [Pyrenochaeta sp. DS3sAY3a]|nr:heavy metal translocating P-type ATPase [Pyrenochaeta sp. DS3sAY3a]
MSTCCSKTKANSGSCSSQPKVDEHARGSRAQGGKTCSSGSGAIVQSGSCSKELATTTCSSTLNSSYDEKGGCCTSPSVQTISKDGTAIHIRREGRNADPEKDAGFEHVAISVKGMHCNDCADKLAKALDAIPGVHGIRINFLHGQADFDIEQEYVSIENVISRAHAATGFIINRIKQGNDEVLHLLVSRSDARALSELQIEGLTDVTVINKTTVSVDYNPTVIGARDLLEKVGNLSQGLASPSADPAVSEGRRKYQKLLGLTLASAVLTIPVVVLAWGEDLVSEYTRGVVSFALGSMVQLLAVPVFYKPALRALIVYRALELDMLVVVSITAAYLYSIVAFSFRLAGKPLDTAEFFETSTLLITLVMLGRLLASYARIRAVAAVSMRSLQSTTALLVHEDGKGEEEIDSRLLQYGDLFKVLPHCRIPTDGVVVEGTSDVDESMLTGESIPVTKQPGSKVIAGTVNSAGTLLVRLSELPGKNTVMDIARMVDEASNSKPRVQDLADHVASYFLPVVSVASLLVFIIWIVVGLKLRDQKGGDSVAIAITYSIAVLAVSCPCALGLAVPMVLVIAGGIAARGGVLIKSAECTERSRKVTDVVFDKTGTLTEPGLDIIDEDFFGNDRDEAARIVQALVQESKHPVSVAVAKYLGDKTGNANVSDLQSIPGSGVQARQNGVLFRAGNAQWTGNEEHPQVRKFLENGLTVLLVTRESIPVALFGLRTRIRAEAVKVATELKRRGIVLHLVSGDQRHAVDAIASTVGIDSANAVAQYTPDQKREYVARLMGDRRKYVLFCGDGTNDAVAVAQAHIGAQVSDSLTSSDVTGGAADVVLLSGLNGIPFLLDISKASFRRIVFNFAWSAVYNILAILLAAGAFVKIRIPPMYAGAGELVSVLPIIAAAMSLLLLKLKP